MAMGFPWIIELHIWEMEWLWLICSPGADRRNGVASENRHACLLNVSFATSSLYNLDNLRNLKRL